MDRHHLVEVFCCPRCRRDLRLVERTLTAGGRVKEGVFVCTGCDDVVGAIRNFKYDFRHFDKEGGAALLRSGAGGGRVLPFDVTDEAVRFDDPRLAFRGAWENVDDKYRFSQGTAQEEVVFRGEFLDVGARILKHPWSGRVRFYVDGRDAGGADLYQAKWSTVYWFPIACDLEPGPHTVRIVCEGTRDARSMGAQVFFHELVITRGLRGNETSAPERGENRVLPLFPVVTDLMARAPADGLILECGGGDRSFADPRYVNVEYDLYQLPHVYADSMHLPFQENVFDLVFSQAMLEHVPNPFTAVAEMRRVLKPGGTVWAGMAFMQPVHAVPSHYFNATAWGLEELFRDFADLQISWFGELSHTIDWLFQTANVTEKVPASEYAELMDRIKALDRLVNYEDLRGVASGVAVQARKRDP